jgi:anti-sigma factor RsiW
MTIRPEHESLLQAHIDGTLSDAERTELDRLLATDNDVRARATELDRLAELVDSLGDVDPPADLTKQILTAIAEHTDTAPAHTAHIARFESNARVAHSGARMDGGIVMGKKVMWGIAAAAVIALAVLRFTGVIPPKEGTEGTIGAAKRYQAQQIAPKDVELGDTSAQAFIQSDLFDQMMHDSNVRQLLSSEAMRAALASSQFRGVLATPGLAQALAGAELRHSGNLK